jgi:hypothetical protein
LLRDGGVPSRQLVDHGAELGDVGLVARIGVGHQGNAAVAGHDQPQPDQAQVATFLLGLTPRRDRRFRVGGVDEGGEVGHVQRQRPDIDAELADDAHRQSLLDLGQLLDAHRVHRVPELAVIQHPSRDLGESVGGGGAPPVGERQLRTRRHHPIQGRQRHIGADTGARIRTARPDHRVNDTGHIQPIQQSPHRSHVPERQVTGPLRQHLPLPSIQQRLDLRHTAQIPLRGQLRLATHPRHLTQVPVRPSVDHLLVQTRHNFRS